ncbi:MAG TPA: ABC transporter ATP-binding protein [Mycobacteriales bacterium]|nr:ABC transporter ATP-binding protein [Mycobacteriales bacterium]
MPDGESGAFRTGLRVLATAIAEQRRVFAVAVSASALFGCMTVASAFVMGQVTSRVILPALREKHTTSAALTTAGLVVLATAVLKVVGIVGRRVGAGTMQYRLQADYRRRITRQYLRLPLAWHRRHPTGELLSIANSDVEATWWPISPLPFACGALVMLVVTVVALLATDPVLAVVGLVIFPAVLVVNAFYTRAMTSRMMRAQELRAAVSEVAHESFDGALVVKTLGREEHETARFRVRTEELRDALIRVGRVRGVFDPLMEALPNLGTLAVLLVGGYRLSSGATSVADLVSVAYLFTVLALPVRAIGWVLGDLPRAVVGWRRVHRVLGETGRQAHGSADLPSAPGPARLDTHRVTFGYDDAAGGARAVDGVSLRAVAGQTIALVGPTGSGKSTLVSLLLRLVDPDTGRVLLDGVDLRELPAGGVSRHAALVGQSTFLFDDRVRDNVTLGLRVGDEAVWRALRLAQADGFVRRLPDGLDTQIGERGLSLSGGQRQRLALARALVRQPRLLVLDDATSSVDPAVEQAILGGLRDADLASTVVVVAYRRATISLADTVVYVERGRVVATGTHEDLRASSPGYADLVDAYARAEEERQRARAAGVRVGGPGRDDSEDVA